MTTLNDIYDALRNALYLVNHTDRVYIRSAINLINKEANTVSWHNGKIETPPNYILVEVKYNKERFNAYHYEDMYESIWMKTDGKHCTKLESVDVYSHSPLWWRYVNDQN